MQIKQIERKTYRPIFAREDIGLVVATVDVEGQTLILSHRDDDGEGVWAADAHFGANGFPHFSHGEGDRTVRKQIAGQELSDMLDAATAALTA